MNQADILQAKLERLGNRDSALRKRGICSHGWCQTHKNGTCECNYCHTVFPSFEALAAAHSEILS